MHYMVKAIHKTTGNVTYYLQSHAQLTGDAKYASKHYLYDKESSANSLMRRIIKSHPKSDKYIWSVVCAEEEGIEVQ